MEPWFANICLLYQLHISRLSNRWPLEAFYFSSTVHVIQMKILTHHLHPHKNCERPPPPTQKLWASEERSWLIFHFLTLTLPKMYFFVAFNSFQFFGVLHPHLIGSSFFLFWGIIFLKIWNYQKNEHVERLMYLWHIG